MIITRTPLRISFLGGGTDYPVWYEKHGGAVLSTTIDKYSYLICRPLPAFFDFKIRVSWSKMELVKTPDEVEHPAVREILKFLGIKDGIEVHYNGDLPARSGLGSSSSFVVGLLHALVLLQGKEVTQKELAHTAIRIEREILKENVGSQDQTAVAVGGLNKIIFKQNHDIAIEPLTLDQGTLDGFQDRLMLFFTGFSRSASEIAGAQIENTARKERELTAMHLMVDEGIMLLKSGDLDSFGKLLHETWQLKRGLSHLITTSDIDGIYASARQAGALGGKLLGAGGGGFMLIYADPSRHEDIKKKLGNLLHVPFKFETAGSKVVYRAEGQRSQLA